MPGARIDVAPSTRCIDFEYRTLHTLFRLVLAPCWRMMTGSMGIVHLNAVLGSLVVTVGFWLIWGEIPPALAVVSGLRCRISHLAGFHDRGHLGVGDTVPRSGEPDVAGRHHGPGQDDRHRADRAGDGADPHRLALRTLFSNLLADLLVRSLQANETERGGSEDG